MRGGDSPAAPAATDRPRRPVNLVYDAVGFGMMVYSRSAFHVEVLGFRRISWRSGPLLISTHRSESDVPVVCSALCAHAGLWRERRHKLHYAARDDLFGPGFFASFPGELPRAAQRILYPVDVGPGLPLVGVHPVSSATRLRLGQVLRQLPPETPLAPILPADVLDGFRDRARELDLDPPATVRDALRADFARVLWRAVEPGELSDPAFVPVWRAQTARATRDFRLLVGLLRDREPVLLFPEGRPSADGAIGPLEAGLGALVRRGRPEVLQPIGLAYDPLTTGRTRALVALGRPLRTPASGVEEAALGALAGATPLTCGQVVAERLLEAAALGRDRLPVGELDDHLERAVRQSREEGRHVDPALASRRRAARLGDALRALGRSGVAPSGDGAVVIDRRRVMADASLAHLARERASARSAVWPPAPAG